MSDLEGQADKETNPGGGPGAEDNPQPRLADRGPALQRRLPLVMLFVLAGVVFCTGITWGLPSHVVDRFLFGEHSVWPGEEIQRLAGGWNDDRTLGADVDIDPLAKSSEPVPLSATDAQRAEIVRRYRLYTYQPDEMITMRALAGMHPSEGRLDPRLYQYGGFWIYPVGGLLKLASVVGLVTLKPDVAWYLDHPEEFGRLYVVARAYTVLWGLVGLWAVFWITRRLVGGQVLPAVVAGLCYICMPVVIDMAHEAKPHLPGVVLQLLAMMAAMRYVETGGRGWWLATAVLCGAAFGMVLSAWPVFIVLPVMVLLRPQSWGRRVGFVIGGMLIGVGVYLITNPYILINAFINRPVLRSNFGNSLAMYAIGRWPEGVVNAARLVADGASVSVALIGALAVVIAAGGYVARVWAGRLHVQEGGRDSRPPGVRPPEVQASAAKDWLLLAAPALLILAQFTALAAGKPGEYGRFAILPDVVLGIAAVAAISRLLPQRAGQAVGLAMLLLLVAIPGYAYFTGFIADSRSPTSRLELARDLLILNEGDARSLAVYAEPAPYDLPPVNLFTWQILLVPKGYRFEPGEAPADAIVRPVDEVSAAGELPEDYLPVLAKGPRLRTPISWANKPFVVWVWRSLFPTEGPPESAPSGSPF